MPTPRTRHLVVMDAYEQLRIGVISLHWNLGQQKGALDAAVVDKHLKKVIDACTRGLARATETSRARETQTEAGR